MRIIEIQIMNEIPANTGQMLLQGSLVPETVKVTERLYHLKRPLVEFPEKEVRHFFTSLEANGRHLQTIKITINDHELLWQKVLELLRGLLPQFVFYRVTLQEAASEKNYYFDFLPIAWIAGEFPFGASFFESISQQLPYPAESARDRLRKRLEFEIAHRELVSGKPETAVEEKRQPPRSAEPLPTELAKEERFPANHTISPKQEVAASETEHLRLENQKLQLALEKIESQVMQNGLQVLQKTKGTVKENWDKRVKISLRDYHTLILKTRYLDQVWALNSELVQKSEKLIFSADQVVYEHNQIQQLRTNFSASEIFLMVDDSEAIEKRAKIRRRPLFSKPFVKLMQMDYDSLQKKAAYFDILQSESYLMERMIQQWQAETLPEEEVSHEG